MSITVSSTPILPEISPLSPMEIDYRIGGYKPEAPSGHLGATPAGAPDVHCIDRADNPWGFAATVQRVFNAPIVELKPAPKTPQLEADSNFSHQTATPKIQRTASINSDVSNLRLNEGSVGFVAGTVVGQNIKAPSRVQPVASITSPSASGTKLSFGQRMGATLGSTIARVAQWAKMMTTNFFVALQAFVSTRSPQSSNAEQVQPSKLACKTQEPGLKVADWLEKLE